MFDFKKRLIIEKPTAKRCFPESRSPGRKDCHIDVIYPNSTQLFFIYTILNMRNSQLLRSVQRFPRGIDREEEVSFFNFDMRPDASSRSRFLHGKASAVTRMSIQRLSIPNEPIDSSTIRPDLLDCILIFRPRATLLIREKPLILIILLV